MLAMNRRDLLFSIGVASVIGIAGCLGDAETPNGPETDTESNRNAATTPSDGDDKRCPPYETERDRAVCSHTVDPDTEAVYIEATPKGSTLKDGTPGDDITLTLYNQSDHDLVFNPHSWRIWHNSETGWEELQQELSGNGRRTTSPNATHSWSFMEAVESIQEEPILEPGLYAAELGVPSPESSDDWIACVALVELDSAE